jgi:hypothetical protein
VEGPEREVDFAGPEDGARGAARGLGVEGRERRAVQLEAEHGAQDFEQARGSNPFLPQAHELVQPAAEARRNHRPQFVKTQAQRERREQPAQLKQLVFIQRRKLGPAEAARDFARGRVARLQVRRFERDFERVARVARVIQDAREIVRGDTRPLRAASASCRTKAGV